MKHYKTHWAIGILNFLLNFNKLGSLYYSDEGETMKRKSLLVMAIFLLMSSLVVFAAVGLDISGTWVGSAEVPNAGEPDGITMVLEKKEGSYTGTISDSMGMVSDAELEELSFEDNVLSFNFSVDTGADFLKIEVSLTVDGDSMSGAWQGEDGSSGSIELKKE